MNRLLTRSVDLNPNEKKSGRKSGGGTRGRGKEGRGVAKVRTIVGNCSTPMVLSFLQRHPRAIFTAIPGQRVRKFD